MHRLPGVFLIVHVLLSAGPTLAQGPAAIARPWQVQSFFADADLTEKTVICVDFSVDGSLWLAVSDGLYHFDGYRWRRYTAEQGLPSDYVRCVLVTSDGTLWIGTDRGAGTFDGNSFNFQGTSGNLAGPSVRRIVEDPDGSLWFCCDQWPVGDVPGGLTRMHNGRFTTWRHSDGLPSDYVSDYVRDSQGRQFVLTNKGLAQFSDEGFGQPLKEAGLWDEDAYVWSLVESDQHGLVAATDENFFQLHGGRWRRVPNSLDMLVQPKLVAAENGEIYSCTTGRGPVICRWDGDGFVPASRRLTGEGGGVEVLAEDPYGAMWICGFEKLLRWERHDAEWAIYGGLGAPRLKDRAGGIWFDAPEDGLIRYHKAQWNTLLGVSAPVLTGRDGQVWMQSSDGLAVWSSGGPVNDVSVVGLLEPRLIGVDGQDTVWAFGSSDDGSPAVAGFDGDRWTLQHLSKLPETVCFVSSDPVSGIWIGLSRNRLPPFHLVHVDRASVKEIPLPDIAQISNPPKLLAMEDESLFLYGFFGLLHGPKDGQSWTTIETPSPTVAHVVGLEGEVWLSSRGHVGGRAALARYRHGIWKTFLDRQGVYAGQDHDKALYLSSHGRIQVVPAGADTFAPPFTTPFETRASSVVAGNLGEYWVGVDNRCYRYVPDQFTPETEILAGDRKLYEDEGLVLRVRGLERFRPTHLDRSHCVSFKMDDKDWTPFEQLKGELRIPELALGTHAVRVRVQDAAGQIDATPATFQFQVLPIPLQSRAWFKPAVSMCFLTMAFLAGVATLNWTKVRHLARGLEWEVAQKTRRLSSSERKYRMLFEDSQDAICLFGADGALHSCNEATSSLLGLSAEQNLSISDVFADANEEARFQHELRHRGHLRGARFRVRKQQGLTFDALLSVNTFTDESVRFSGYQVIIRDISDLVQLQKRLSESNKMEAIGRMAGGIAHDFNNFLAVVMYGVDLVKLKAKDQSAIDESLEMIVDAVERGKNLTFQIQTFSSAPVLDLGVIDTYQVLSGIPKLLKGLMPPSVELAIDLEDGLGHIFADPQQLEQVVINLAVNACHAMPDGGKLTIRSHNVDIDEQNAKELRIDCPGTHVLLEVTDTGAGMDAATCERIFDPFFTTKPFGQGTGLGLAIVYGIIQQFHGRIQVNSTLEEGTRFEIYFPIRREEAVMGKVVPTLADSSCGTETVLLVEDEANIREMVKGSFERYGYTVHVAEDGLAAQRLLETNGLIDMVVSDIVMTGMSGFDLVRWLKANRPHIGILLISGYPHPGADEVLTEIDVPFLKKPFQPAVLASRVRQVLDSQTKTAGV